ncbi:universal stress protein [Pontimicrobium aquaticum]|uniref:Universal stress protein n=1 Tax=Pontimicrobium aquaticum TaxID=2565367 RepID=A0A4U0EVP0_9FLAO|nr:universal stress protein [Pontimicrobium aquaticum]
MLKIERILKSILLPTDFSNNSINAINYAVELLKDEVCEFYVINIQKASSFVSDDLMTMTSSATIYHTLIDIAKKSIKNIIDDVKETYNNNLHQFYSIVDYDNFVDGINQACESRNIDLIIMGTKGASGAEKVLFGSNTARVMQRCNTPVLAIPDGCKFKGVDKIAFTSNYLIKYSNKDLKSLYDISSLYKSSIDIIHVTNNGDLTSSQENNRAFLDAYFSNLKHEFIDLEKADIFKAIQDYIKEKNIKILAMTSRHHSFLERLFTRHLVEAFAFNIDIPFLVMENSNQ